MSAYDLVCRSAYDLTCRSRRRDHDMVAGVGASEARFTVRTRVEGRHSHVTLTFGRDRLEKVELVLLDGPRGAPFDPAVALESMRAQTDWMASLLGVPLTIKAVEVDGKMIEPVGDETWPRHAVLPWGEVVSMIDTGNGGSSVVVTYKTPQ